MEQTERRKFLIEYLLKEIDEPLVIPRDDNGQKSLLRALLNVRMPMAASEEFLHIQDEYLQEEVRLKGIVSIDDLTPVAPDIYLWKGDITRLKCDAIVNAANAKMLGCFSPNHTCIDNAIHTFAGVQLRQECADIMKAQGKDEETGRAKITKAYNLPCKHIIHTVGPMVYGELTEEHEQLLADSYCSCIALADSYGLEGIAFCCISSGEFHFPRRRAAQIAVQTITEYKRLTGSKIKVIFDVFVGYDYEVYAELLGANK